jgi:hypothetical protein
MRCQGRTWGTRTYSIAADKYQVFIFSKHGENDHLPAPVASSPDLCTILFVHLSVTYITVPPRL